MTLSREGGVKTMSNIIIIHDASATDALAATSLIRKLIVDGHRIHCKTEGSALTIFQYCKGCVCSDLSQDDNNSYDVLINLSPSLACTTLAEEIKAKQKFGYTGEDIVGFFNDGAMRHYCARHVRVPTEANLFQLIFGLAEMPWHGEGYYLGYFPRNRTKRSTYGIAVQNQKLGSFVASNLKIKGKIHEVPFKYNILKQFDEVNRCKTIITDSDVILHVSLCLRKQVEYLVPRKPAYKIEMFGSGNVHLMNPYVREPELI